MTRRSSGSGPDDDTRVDASGSLASDEPTRAVALHRLPGGRSSSSAGGRAHAPGLVRGAHVGSRWEVLGSLGAGGFGEVYRVRDTRGGVELALKLQRVEGQDRAALESMKSEFAMLAALRHPNLARVHDFGFADRSVAFFTQDLVSGVTLRDAAINLTTSEGVELIAQLCRALDYLHARGILHRDIKPPNVLVDEERGHLTLLDFGVARAFGSTEEGRLIGTLGYLAPEAITGGLVDARTDLYALGVTLYELVSGARPFVGTRDTVVTGHVLHEPPPLPVRVPPALQSVIVRLLAKDPRDRPASAMETLGQLARAVGASTTLDTDETLASHVLSARWVGTDGLLERLAARAAVGSPSLDVVVLAGEAGAGKSRLLRELRQRAQLAGHQWLEIAARRSEGAHELVRELAEQILTEGRIAMLADEDRLELARALPRLRRPGQRIAIAADPDAARRRRIAILGSLLSEALDERPTVLSIEDAHWTSPDERARLVELVSAMRAAGARGLVLVTSRPGAVADELEVALRGERLTCPLLDTEAAARLVESGLGDRDLLAGTATADALVRAPVAALWLQETLRSAIERGVLVRRDGRWARVGELDVRPLRDVLAARLAMLSSEAMRAATALAVLARPVSLRDVAGASRAGAASTAQAIADLCRRGIVDTTSDLRGRAVQSMHDRFVDVVIDAAGSERVREVELAAGAWLLRHARGDWREVARAAEHFSRGGDVDRAIACFARAAAEAEKAGRPDLAVRLIEREIGLRTSRSERPVERWLRLYDVARRCGVSATATRALSALVKDLRHARPEHRVEILLRAAREDVRSGVAARARRRAGRVVERARALGMRRVECEALVVLAEVDAAHSAQERALASYEAAALLAAQIDDASLETRALLGVTLASLRAGRSDRARSAASRASRRARVVGDPDLLSDALRSLGNVLRERGELSGAVRAYQRAVNAARRAASMEVEAKALNNLGATAHWVGRVDEAREALARSIALKERLGARPSALIGVCNLASLATALGRFGEAHAALDRVLSDPDAALAVPLARSNAGDLLAVEGKLDSAVECFRDSDASYAALGWTQLRGHALIGLVRTLLLRGGQGDVEEAVRAATALDAIDASGDVANAKRRHLTAYAVLADARGAHADALRHAHRAVAERDVRTAFEDVFGTAIEAQWIVAILEARVGHRSRAERAALRARCMLERQADMLSATADRVRFLDALPLHRAILAGSLDVPAGCTWPR